MTNDPVSLRTIIAERGRTIAKQDARIAELEAALQAANFVMRDIVTRPEVTSAPGFAEISAVFTRIRAALAKGQP